MESIQKKLKIGDFLNLKAAIMLFLRKHYKSTTIIYPDMLAAQFKKTKSAISQALKILREQDLITMAVFNDFTTKRHKKQVQLTQEGFLLAAHLIYNGLNEKEMQIIKSLNLGK